MIRDGGRSIERNPFNDLPENWWPSLPQREPDPYSEQERDTILAYYRNNRPHWAYAFVYFRFWTGTRPSEAVALKWGSVDLLNGKATVSLSRHLGEENATKTRASRRTLALLPNVVELLKSIVPLRVEPDSYVFTDGQGNPSTNRNSIAQLSRRAACQRDPAAAILQPTPYLHQCCTDHRMQSKMDCRTNRNQRAMIQEHYGKYIRDDGDALLRAYVERPKLDAIKAKTGTFSETFSSELSNYRNLWRPRRDLNPCYRRERPVSWAGLDDGDVMVSRAGLEPATLCLKGRCSTD